MAGEAGYYMVALAGNAGGGIVKVGANQHPISVGGHKVAKFSYLGINEQSVLANYDRAASNVGFVGGYELGPPGSGQGTLGDNVDRGTLLQYARDHGAGILTQTPNAAEWDPTFTILAAGLGGIVFGAVRAAAAGAAGSAGADAGSAATGAGAGGATSKIAGTAGKVAGAVAGAAGISALFGNIEMWKGIGLILGGVLILLIAGREVAKL